MSSTIITTDDIEKIKSKYKGNGEVELYSVKVNEFGLYYEIISDPLFKYRVPLTKKDNL